MKNEGIMSIVDILKELGQDKASNDIGVVDLKVNVSHIHTTSSTLNRMKCSSQSYRKIAKNDDMTSIDVQGHVMH